MSYKPIVQTLPLKREKITLAEAITLVGENERTMAQRNGGVFSNDQALNR